MAQGPEGAAMPLPGKGDHILLSGVTIMWKAQAAACTSHSLGGATAVSNNLIF